MPRSDFLKIKDNNSKTRTLSKGSKSANKPTNKKKLTRKSTKATTAPDVEQKGGAIVTFRVFMAISRLPCSTSGTVVALVDYWVSFFLFVGLFADLEPFEGVRVLALLS